MTFLRPNLSLHLKSDEGYIEYSERIMLVWKLMVSVVAYDNQINAYLHALH